MGSVQSLEFFRGVVITQYALVNGLDQQASGDDVERGVIFDVLQRHLNDGFVQLLGSDAIEQRQFQLTSDLCYPGNRVFEPLCCVLDSQVNFVGVVRLTVTISLHHSDVHNFLSFQASRDHTMSLFLLFFYP